MHGADVHAVQELGDEARLAHTRLAEHGDELTARLGLRPLPGLRQRRELCRTANEARGVAPHRGVEYGHEPVRGHRRSLPLQLEMLHGPHVDPGGDEAERFLSDQDLAWRRRLLEPGSHVHRVSCRESLRGPGHDLSRVHADSAHDPEFRPRLPHLHGRLARPERIILVRKRYAEHGHHRVADELLHRPLVRLDDSLHPLEVARQQRAQRFGIRLLAQGRRAGQVTENHRHRLPELASCGDCGRAALGAELERRLSLETAGCADAHA